MFPTDCIRTPSREPKSTDSTSKHSVPITVTFLNRSLPGLNGISDVVEFHAETVDGLVPC